ncbi:myosin-binding protein 7-like [Andrographis paniculata]|uniref:myosin-binding protein 7-like n=1 Tax=Andrographis paniculata TaxID=175694 RepID=UPI0021E82D9E|nr:myosin-binding protein 7-like [Andrographis paniculata]
MESCKSPLLKSHSNSNSESKCCDCACSCSSTTMSRSLSGTNLQSFKRKHVELEEQHQSAIPQNARVEIENECKALREAVGRQQQTIQDLISDLEQERNASSSAANEAMSMILKLQKERAEIEMELRQFQRFAEEKMAHDEQEMLDLEEFLYKREHAIEALNCEVQAYKHRLMSFGLSDAEADEANSANGESLMNRNNSIAENLEGQFEIPSFEFYPQLKCKINESHIYHDDDDLTEIERSAFGDTPYSRDQLKDLEFRINQLEQSPRTIQPDSAKIVFENVIAGQSPRRPRHLRKVSTDSMYSPFKGIDFDYATESPKFGATIKKVYSHMDMSSNLRKADNASEYGDEMCDRVYTIDSIHQRASVHGAMDTTTPRESLIHSDMRDLEIQKLYARLRALEADRESMRQAIVSVGTDKAQLVLLKEIAQNLCKEMSTSKANPVEKQSGVRRFSFVSAFKSIMSFIFWRRRARRCRHSFGLSPEKEGLLLLLDRSSRVGQWRSVSISALNM